MNPISSEWTYLLWLGLTIVAGFLSVRFLEGRDLRRVVRQEREALKRHPQMRLFR
ncbi:hypothetical protein [Candidatus Korobacter versatilis]|uniref:hypothetical protein n=1 Tax=Candidatus Korobacter versatilis TaxID=658062 RepID=UPI0002E54D11|nr:hypothetical protein [Candidatus Koribacter versatilis]